MMRDMELSNPVAGDREVELDVLSTSVNPVRLKNNPIALEQNAIIALYSIIVK